MEFLTYWIICGCIAFCMSIYKDWYDGEDITIYLLASSALCLLMLGIIGLAIVTYLTFQTFLHNFGEKTLVKGRKK